MTSYGNMGRSIAEESKGSVIDRRRADYKSEVHFIGEIVSGSLFPPDEEIFCEASLEMSSDWALLNQFANKYSMQTQCCMGTVLSWERMHRTKMDCMFGDIPLIFTLPRTAWRVGQDCLFESGDWICMKTSILLATDLAICQTSLEKQNWSVRHGDHVQHLCKNLKHSTSRHRLDFPEPTF